MKLIILYGPPAVGKLTVAQELAALTGYKIFHNHHTVDLANSIFEMFSAPYMALIGRIRFDTIETAAQEGISLVFTFVYAADAGDAEFVRKVVELVERHGGEVCFVQLICSREELQRRVGEESRRRFAKISDLDKLDRALERWNLYEEVEFGNRLSINNSNLPPRQVAEQIINHFNLDRV